MPSFLRLALLSGLLATPAWAHPGDHTHLSLLGLVQHYAEADHLAFLALTVTVGWLAYRMGRRAEAKAQARKPEARR